MNLKKIYNLNVNVYEILFISVLYATFTISLETSSVNAENQTMFSTTFNSTLMFVDEKYNIIAAGDWYCNDETERTIQNVINANPDLIITTGDHVKDVKSADCWIEMSQQLRDKMRIAVGNHDAEFKKIYKQIVKYHQLENPYYSHDFQNVHFISMSTEHPFEEGSKQYEFIKSDLEKISANPNIDWIIVHQHKPLYSTKQDKQEANDLRDIYQRLFHKYDVDLVLSSHNQYYERTYPILYNEGEESSNGKSDIPNPIITIDHRYEYPPTDGIIFLSVGTAGDELDPVKESYDYHVIQESKHGFLNMELSNHGKQLAGTFYTNDGKILDHFKVHES
jgi:predicted MPP superfamily phosphohydrolase